jgi:hypothetical protein
MQGFPQIEELVVVKVYCQNRGIVSDAELDLKMYLQSNSLELRKELSKERKQRVIGRKLMDEKKANFVQKLKEQKKIKNEQGNKAVPRREFKTNEVAKESVKEEEKKVAKEEIKVADKETP